MGSSKVVYLVFALQLASCLITIDASDDLDRAEVLNVRANFEPHNETWLSFKFSFGRQYNNVSEEAQRKGVFLDNVKMIEAHNAEFLKGNATYWMGINHLTDLTFEEFTDRYLNNISLPEAGADVNAAGGYCSRFVPGNDIQTSKVWWPRTPVKNQTSCAGSGWAFSTTGAIEYLYWERTGKYVPLSEQQLIDCSRPYGTNGCKGGWPSQAYTYINAAPGIESNVSYPYTAKDSGPCLYNPSLRVTGVSCKSVAPGNEADLKAAVNQSPVSVVIDVTDSFRHYKGGVFTDPTCKTNSPKHAVLVVGYAYFVCVPSEFWVVQNSWGTTWGAGGFMRMRRNQNNMCGIASYATFPILPLLTGAAEQPTCRASSNMALSLSIVTGIVLLVQAIVS